MKEFNNLLQIMKRLRNPANGCPWDLIQDVNTLKEYVLEETYELLEAIEINSVEKQKEELGDLLLQIVFLSQINQEKDNFNIKDVINGISKKLVNRHPHIFSNLKVESAEDVKTNWEKIKKREKKGESIISDYPDIAPSLLSTKKISEQASRVGFDWKNAFDAIKKVEEEIKELKTEMKSGNKEKIAEEIGDVLFAVANVSRLLKINPEFALKNANKKFIKRFRFIEKELKKRKKDINSISLEEMEKLWQESKSEASG